MAHRLHIIVLLALLGVMPLAAQQPLTLHDAVARALAGNPQHRIAVAAVKIGESNTKEARAALLPHIDFSETILRGNDPVYVFGTKLRQQRFGPGDFALNQLNTPTPIGNYQARFGGEWQLFDSLQSRNRVQSARLVADSMRERLTRSDQELIFRTVEAYLAVLRAQRQVVVAEQAEKTAAAMLARVQDRYGRGLVVEADWLSAQVNAAQRKQQTIRARNDLRIAQAALNLVMAQPADNEIALADNVTTPSVPPTLAELEAKALSQRPDLKAIADETTAQSHNVRAAKGAFGPKVSLFGGWETDTSALVSNGGNNWLGGVQIQIDLFAGGAKVAQLERQRALLEQAEAARSAEQDRVRLEVRRAYYDLSAALEQVEVARLATTQADESLRIQQNRYENGLSPLTDLLRVEEDARRTQSDYWETLYRAVLSQASVELATGTLSLDSSVVKP
jgi:outer membrane protein